MPRDTYSQAELSRLYDKVKSRHEAEYKALVEAAHGPYVP